MKSIDKENKNGIIYGDIFYLRYYEENVFLFVCDTDEEKVKVHELEKVVLLKDGQKVEQISSKLAIAKEPMLVDKGEEKSFWVETGEKKIYVPVDYMCPLYEEVIRQEKSKCPKFGVYEAVLLEKEKEDGLGNYYWEISSKNKKKNKKKSIVKKKFQNIA